MINEYDRGYQAGYLRASREISEIVGNEELFQRIFRLTWDRLRSWVGPRLVLWPQGVELSPNEPECKGTQEKKSAAHYEWLDEIWRPWYRQYLSSDLWRRRREFILARAKHMCEMCHDRAATNIHHLTYDRVGQEEPDDLVAVCDGCHKKVHNRE